MKYKIYYGFLDRRGYIEHDDKSEFVYDEEIEADSEMQAVVRFVMSGKFACEPQILGLELVKR